MHPSVSNIGYTILIAALVLFFLYRRFRRNFGRQPLRPKRMIFRIVALTIVCVVLLASPFRSVMSFAAAAVGAVIGIGLAFYATAHTKFETTPQGRFYRPHTYIGMAITALLIGRLIYRLIVVYPMLHGAMQQAAQTTQMPTSPFAAYQRSPLTLGIYFILAGYYICYYAGVLIKSRQHRQTDDGNQPKPIS
ncbi:MAG: DUF1453 domain-containing protein [Gammaproteobacteria bacterium]